MHIYNVDYEYAHAKKSILCCDRHSISDNDQTLFVIAGTGLHTRTPSFVWTLKQTWSIWMYILSWSPKSRELKQ